MINHFWWSSGTCGGNVENLREKWTSILHHVSDIHSFEENKSFRQCAHGEIEPRAWLIPGSPAHNALKTLVMDKRLLNLLPYFTEFKHTGNLEVYHSLLLKYCPKRLRFSHNVMIARTQLAVMHFNSIINAEQVFTKDNVPRYKLQYSKISQSYVVKAIKQAPEKEYLQDLIQLIVDTVKYGKQLTLPQVPQFSSTGTPSNEEVVRHHRTRFKPI